MRLFTAFASARSSKPGTPGHRAAKRAQFTTFETLERREMMSASSQAAAPAALHISQLPTVEMSLGSSRSLTANSFTVSRIFGPIGPPPVFRITAIMGKYNSLPAQVKKILGPATSGEQNVPGIWGAKVQFYEGGAIYWSKSTGAHVVYGEIGGRYAMTPSMTDAFDRPLQPILGLPTSDEVNVPGRPGARMNRFQNGTIYWSATTGAHVVYGAIAAYYEADKDPFGNRIKPDLGLPTSDEMNVPGKPGSRMNTFEGGAIYWTFDNGIRIDVNSGL